MKRWLTKDPLGRLYVTLTLTAWFVACLAWAHGWTL